MATKFLPRTDAQRAEMRREVEARIANLTPEQRAAIVALQERARLGRLARVALKAVRDVVEGRQ